MSQTPDFLNAITEAYRSNRSLADRAIVQVPDDRLRIAIDPGMNSIAQIMKHVAGNLLSRWTDFLTTDGEKPWRNRDNEFVDDFLDRAAIEARWNEGWSRLIATLSELTDEDLLRTVTVRGVPHSVPEALSRSLGHTCYHVGQIVMLARIHAGDAWQVLTIPRGQSEKYNADHWGESGRSHS